MRREKLIKKLLFLLLVQLLVGGDLLANEKAHKSVQEKKERYYKLLVPVVYRVYNEMNSNYRIARALIKEKKEERLEKMREFYKAQSNEELLKILKPHPPSITLAQGALESAWGTSRFFHEANNVFGMWSIDASQKRIVANEKRDGKQQIWLRKFDTLEESVREYYILIGKAKAYKEFQEAKMQNRDVFSLVSKLDKYSELGETYTKELRHLIKQNDLLRYDSYVLEQ